VITNKAAGFTRFQFLAALVFVISLAGFVSMHYLPGNSDSVSQPAAMATADTRAVAPVISQPVALPVNSNTNNDSRPDSGFKSTLARFFNNEVSGNDDIESPQSVTDAQHAAWAEDLFAQLHSPDPVPVAAEELAPVISGRVMTTHGWPVGGIEVGAQFRNYFKDAESNAIQSALGTQVTTTNDDGFYAFRDLPEGIYLISTKDAGSYAPARIEVRTGVKYADLSLTTQRNAQLRGVVTDPMGNELDGVRIMPLVKGIPAGSVSGVNGEFAFTVTFETGTRSFPVRFQRQGYREQRYQVTEADWANNGSMTLEVSMEPVYEWGRISGSVTDADGMQVAGESVQLYSRQIKRSYQASTDEAGEFLFPTVEVADDYQLAVKPVGPYKDYELVNLDVTVQEQRLQVALEPLDLGPRLTGRMVNVNGEAVPGVTLVARSTLATNQALQVSGDREGRYAIDNTPTGELVFAHRSMPFYTISGVRVSGDENDTQRNVSLVLDWGRYALRGRVVDDRNRPIAAPRIHLTWSHIDNGVRSRSSRTTTADANGQFLFTDLGPGEHKLIVNAPGFEAVRLRPTVGAQGNELVVRLEERTTNFEKTSL